jgi:Ssp1 endopeptidase immunity protein Rap1a
MRNVLAAVLMVWAAGVVAAEPTGRFIDGNKLLAICTDPDANSQSYCNGYTQGVADSHVACLPVGVNFQQLKDAVVNYLRAHLQTRHWSAGPQVWAAIQETWCPQH